MSGFVDGFNSIIGALNGWVWGPQMLFILIGMGVFVTFYLGLIQFRGFLHGVKVVRGKYDRPEDPGQITHFQALSTSLSGTVGLGNIAGVAVAISVGGPGAFFWMFLSGFFGMASKFIEVTLGTKYRQIDDQGVVYGGPMYYISEALKKVHPSLGRPVSMFYAFFCVFATLGAANLFQANQVAKIFNSFYHIPTFVTGLVLAFLVGIVIIGGITRIADVTSKVVPLMGMLYVLGGLMVILLNIGAIPAVLSQIVQGAFGFKAIGGAALGTVIKVGLQRGVFSNEGGVGTSTFAHAAAATKEPVREGLVALLGPFIDTIVICSTTAFVILVSGVGSEKMGGVELTANAFNASIPYFGTYFLPLCCFLFAYSTIISWSYYGENSMNYLFKRNKMARQIYRLMVILFCILGAVSQLKSVLNFSDLAFGLLVYPNILAVAILLPHVKKITEDYFKRMKEKSLL